MDILISSNLERLIYHAAGNDDAWTAELMQSLAGKGRYEVTQKMKENMQDFIGGHACIRDTQEIIRKIYMEYGYVLDPHTAVAAHVYEKYRDETKDCTQTVIVSTASPYKFAKSVLEAVYDGDIPADDYEQALLLEKLSGIGMPKAIKELHNAQIVHEKVCKTDKMQAEVEKILKII
jgi:threonine synthase